MRAEAVLQAATPAASDVTEAAKPPVRVLLLTRYGPLGASSRLRMLQYVPLLEAHGFQVTSQPLLRDAVLQGRYRHGHYAPLALLSAYARRLRTLAGRRAFDVAWVEKEALPWLPATWERWLLRGVPVVLDFDDAVFHTYDRHPSPLLRRLLGDRIDQLMRHARTVVAGNDYLASRARAAGAGEVQRVPTVVDLRRYPAPAPGPGAAALPRIAWIGSPSTAHYLRGLAAPLQQLARAFRFRLRVIGAGEVALPGVEVESLPWDEASEAQRLRECDIGIMPLVDGPWERGKCGYKLVQYMACGLPVVASAVGANVDMVQGRGVGFLAANDADWTAHLSALLGDAALRQRMGSQGRAEVERRYSVQAQLACVAGVLREAAR